MKALVTGATGFLGSHLVRRLIKAGHSVRILYRSPSKLAVLNDLAFERAQADLNDAEALKRACDGCQVVFHAAAKADYWKDNDQEALFRINVDGTRNVLRAAQSAAVQRVIFTSSASAVGIRPGAELADESVPFNLPPRRFWYAWSKVKAEEAAAEFAADGLDVIILNPTVIIGPGDVNVISGTFIIETARWQWALPMSSGGLAVIDVRDAAQAHVNAIDRGRRGERYILNTANYAYREWFRMIAAAAGVRPPIFSAPDWMLEPAARLIEWGRRRGIQTPIDANQMRLGGTCVYFDGRKAYDELFTPRIDIETSLKETFQWYAERGYIKRSPLTRWIGSI